jgi:hypothetical protein
MLCGVVGTESVLAEDAESKTSAAVADILFKYNADEFSSYVIGEDGSLDFTFARNTPEVLYSKILNELKNHPDIKGVIAGKDGPTCSSF